MAISLEDVVVTGDLTVTGTFTPTGGAPAGMFTRASMVQETSKDYPLLIELARRHDHPALGLPETSADDDLGVEAGTFGTDSLRLHSWDVKSQNAVKTLYARWSFQLPPEYVAGEDAKVKMRVVMSAAADVSATVDVEAYVVDGEGSYVGGDLVTTTAIDMNSTSAQDVTFTLDDSGLAPGSWLEIRVAVAIRDNAGSSAVQAFLSKTRLLLSVKG